MKFLADVQVDDEVIAFTKVMTPLLSVDLARGEMIQKANLYEQLLPEGLTMDIIKKVHEYENRFAQAMLLAVTDQVSEVFMTHPKITVIQATFPTIGKDIVRCSVNRCKKANDANPGIEIQSGIMMSYPEHEGHFSIVAAE